MPPAPSDIDSRVDLALEAVCMKALAKRPEERYQTAREMRTALKDAVEGRGSTSTRVASVPPPPKRDSGRPSTPPPSGAPTSDLMAQGRTASQAGRTSSQAERTASQSERTASGAREVPIRESQKITAAGLRDAEPMHTADTMDPEEAARAIREARSRLASVRPGPISTPPQSEVATVPPAAGQKEEPKSNLGPILLAIVATAVIVAGIMLAMR